MPAAGLAAGVAVALGLPALLLVFGQFLGPIVITILIVLALIVGGGLAIVSAFFGTIMPKEVSPEDAGPRSGGPPK